MDKGKAIKLNQLVRIQRMDGNWNYDEYMFGFLNGMILARAVLQGKDPKFKNKPKKFLAKKYTVAYGIQEALRKPRSK